MYVWCSNHNLNISFVRHMTVQIRSKNVLSVYHTFRFRFARFLSISCLVVSVHWPLIDLYLSGICAIIVRFVRSILRS